MRFIQEATFELVSKELRGPPRGTGGWKGDQQAMVCPGNSQWSGEYWGRGVNPVARDEWWGPSLSAIEGFKPAPRPFPVSLGSEKRRGAATLPEAAWETSPPPCLLVEEVPGLWVTRDSNRVESSPAEAGQVGPLLQDWV